MYAPGLCEEKTLMATVAAPIDERMRIATGENRTEEWYLLPDDIRELQRQCCLSADHRRIRNRGATWYAKSDRPLPT